MQRTSAPNIGEAPLPQRARSYWKTRFSAFHGELEKLLEAERAQLPPWFVVGSGTGIAAWFGMNERGEWASGGLLAEASGFDGDPADLGSTQFSDCSKDACVADIDKGGSRWRLLATRSAYRIDWEAFTRACAGADIVVSDRRLPRGCATRWLRLDPQTLSRSGGLAIYLSSEPWVDTVADRVGRHPWAAFPP